MLQFSAMAPPLTLTEMGSASSNSSFNLTCCATKFARQRNEKKNQQQKSIFELFFQILALKLKFMIPSPAETFHKKHLPKKIINTVHLITSSSSHLIFSSFSLSLFAPVLFFDDEFYFGSVQRPLDALLRQASAKGHQL
jgi:hypothetical protein